ncbi:GTP cyclohydrolase 1-like [Bolinopsis microptera]|uniref:GTP cyclohydrolase 1-like n=1 Tax=Bolinopsis microptera TaxID=2820187 RepID=UPI0030795489
MADSLDDISVNLSTTSISSDEVSGVSKINGDGRVLWRSDSLIEGYVGGNTKPMSNEVRRARLEEAFRTIIECVGEDPNRGGLKDTPSRAAKSILFLTKGYEENLDMVVKNAKFEEDYMEMVTVRDIEFHSLCEHHLIPFYGKIHIGYIPTGKVLGLSKLARIAEMYTRRFQNQERITKQIANAVVDAIRPSGVGVIIEGSHMCMSMRGVQKSGAETLTSTMLGTFLDDPRTRDEFLRICTRR